MSHLKRTLLAAAGFLAILALASSAKAACPTPPGVQFSTGGSFTQVRGEGITENVGQVNLLASNSGTVCTGSSITITYNAAITQHAGAASLSCIIGGVAGCPGTLTVVASGTQFVISFTADIAFTAVTDQITISQIRVNATQVATNGAQIFATPSAVSANPGSNPVTFNPAFGQITVGVVSLPSTTITNLTSGTGVGLPLGVLTCFPPPNPGAPVGFAFRMNEVIPNAWTTLAQETAYTPADLNLPGNGSWITVTLTGVPAGFSVTANTPTANGVNPFPVIALIGVGSAVSAPGPGGPIPVGIATGGAAATVAQTVAGTPIIFTYAFTATTLAALEQAVMNYGITATAPATTVAPGGLTGPITATIAYAPLQPSPAPAINTGAVVRFAANNLLGTLVVANVSDCITRLLHPWVLGGATGYDTGIAIANTSLDSPAFTAPNNAIPQSGTCTLTGFPFTGNGAAAGTPVQTTIASVAAGNQWANNVSQVTGFAGFRGALLVVCNFLNAHDFVFITNGFGSLTGPSLAEGYLGLVVPNASRVAALGEGLLQ